MPFNEKTITQALGPDRYGLDNASRAQMMQHFTNRARGSAEGNALRVLNYMGWKPATRAFTQGKGINRLVNMDLRDYHKALMDRGVNPFSRGYRHFAQLLPNAGPFSREVMAQGMSNQYNRVYGNRSFGGGMPRQFASDLGRAAAYSTAKHRRDIARGARGSRKPYRPSSGERFMDILRSGEGDLLGWLINYGKKILGS
jgi:hypothetical protein